MADQGTYKGIKFEPIQQTIEQAEELVITRLEKIKADASEKVDVGAMFDLQWMMNKFTQLCEAGSAVIGACHSAIQSVTRQIK